MPQAPSFPYFVKDYDSWSADSCKDVCRKIGNVSVTSERIESGRTGRGCRRNLGAAPLHDEIQRLSGRRGVCALSPLVTVTFQIPACQGFGDSLSRS